MQAAPGSTLGGRGAAGDAPSYTAPLATLTSLFFMWGFITCLNDILIPHLKAAFSLSFAQAALIQFCFFTAYFLASLPASALVKRMGYRRGIVIGLLAAAAGCALFYPAASTRVYGLFLGALFVLASGITLLQVSANPYVAILGKPATASARLNLTQAFNSLGTFLAPLVGGVVIFARPVLAPEDIAALLPDQRASYYADQASAVQVPYLVLTALLVGIAIAMSVMRLPKIDGADGEALPAEEDRGSAWRYRHLVLGALAIFVYVGAEVSIGSFLISFFKEPQIAGLDEATGSHYVALYWGGAMVGRFVGSALLSRVRAGRMLALNAVVAAALAIGTMALTGHVAMWSILAVGLFNSIMFPTIFTLAVRGLGRHTEQGSGILCMAIVGGAIIPVGMGALADRIGIHHAFFLPAICYLYIAWYGLKGSGAPAR